MTKMLSFALLLMACGCAPKPEDIKPTAQSSTLTFGRVATSPKKGVGLAESAGNNTKRLDSLAVAWYYNWGYSTSVTTTKTFVPMAFKIASLTQLSGVKPILLGFNEPDNTSQANITVSSALANWPTVTSHATRVGSPATAGNPLTAGSWLEQFMAGKPRVDFITVHWYKGPDSQKFISDLTAIYAKYGKPIWVTEFAPQTVSSSTSAPTKYTQTQVNAFIAAVVPWLEQQIYIEKYAWHDSKSGTSAIFDAAGNLTATGKAYRDAK